MTFEELLRVVGQEPVFETGLLLIGDVNPEYLRRQMAEWVNAGKLWQLRRGLYTLAPPYQKIAPHPYLVANRLRPGSYVSLQAALAHHGLIPEHVAAVTSVTTRRPGEWRTPVGDFLYHHIQTGLLFGYQRVPVAQSQYAFVAGPEKALLDLVYFQPEGDDIDFLESLRLQSLERLDTAGLRAMASRTGKPKLKRAAERIAGLILSESEGYQVV